MHNKILLILSLTNLLTLTSSSTSPHHLHSNDLKILWEVWKEQNHKSYEKAEEAARFAIFVENYKRVTDYNILDNGVTLTLNKFADLTLDEFNAYYSGTYLANFDIFDLNTTNIVDFSGFDLPDTVDWREQGATTPVQSQGTCGSCWAWSVIGALEGLNYITTGKLVPFSVQQLLDCDESNHGCEGGWYNRAFNYTASSGILREEDYPYTESESNCQYDENKAVKVNSGYSYVQPKNASALKASLAVQPVALSVQAYQIIMQFYRSGVIKGDCEGDADHAVLAVGYVNMDGEEAFVVKNSYGDDWGDNGYVYISTDDTINSGHGACGVLFRPIVPVV